MTKPASSRLHYIDFMKGLCILFIVINHADQRIFELLGEHTNFVLESFRIPMYYFISGVFFKTYDGFGDFVRRKVNNMIIPLLFFYLLSCLVIGLSQWFPPLHRTFGSFEWSMLIDPLTQRLWRANVPLWFLLSLFEVNVICYFLHRCVSNQWVRWCIAIPLSVAGYYLSTNHCDTYLMFDTALLGIPYFMLGSQVKRLGVLEPSRHDRWGCIALPLVLAAIYPFAQEINLWPQVIPHYLYLYAVPTLSILALTWCCKRLGYVPVICYVGRYSLVVLCTHAPILLLVERCVQHFSASPSSVATSMVTVAIIILVELPLIWLATRYLPHFTAQKPFFEKGWQLTRRFF